MIRLFIAVFLTFSFSLQSYGSLEGISPLTPDEVQTPGDLCTVDDPDFAEYRYLEDIAYCERNVSYHQRAQIYDLYNVPEEIRDQYTIDHLIPLSLGGSNEFENLWPEHKEVKALRPNLENEVFYALNRGEITQKKAIQIILEAKLNP